ncbi:MAG: efflux RND transporter permease subunit, partial [Muribaculaceae bacterium]|nr:efflux RND transporter permease subunit [Muribaculaceae bacterium]
MGTAYSAAAETMKKRARFTLGMPPMVTALFLVATITFMVLGWYTLEAPVKCIIASLCAIIAIMGIFNKRFHEGFETGFNRVLKVYNKCTAFFINHKITSFGLVAASIALLVWLMSITPSALVPNEDTGMVFCMIDMPPGTSQERTNACMDSVNNAIMKIPAVKYTQKILGYSFIAGQGSTYGTFIIKLKPWEERDKTESADAVIGQIYALTSTIKDGRIVSFAPPMIPGYSITNGFEIKMQDKTGGDINEFFAVVQSFLGQLNQQPEIQMAYTTFNPTFPQYIVDIDAAKAKQAGISPQTILTTLQGYYGGMYVSNFNRFGKIYRVMMQ